MLQSLFEVFFPRNMYKDFLFLNQNLLSNKGIPIILMIWEGKKEFENMHTAVHLTNHAFKNKSKVKLKKKPPSNTNSIDSSLEHYFKKQDKISTKTA